MRPVIIGAGPVGTYTASLIKKLKPVIFEEHKVIGRPVQCAGLINKRIDEIIKLPKEVILNTVRGARFFSKNNSVTIDSGRKTAYVINRVLFDKHLANESGAEIKLGEPVINYELKDGLMNISTSKSELKTELLIDASGPKKPRDYVIGLQARAKLKRDPEFVELHFNTSGLFSWVIPEGNGVCRIGLGTKGNGLAQLKLFLRRLGVNRVIDRQAGLIPLSVEQFFSDNIIRVGDSAGQVKSTTGGGIITGLLSAEFAAKAVIKAYEKNDFSKSFFKTNYHKPWAGVIGHELKIHSIIRRILNKLDDRGYDTLIKFLSNNKITIEKHGDMDFPSKFLSKLIRFKNLLYGFKLIYYLIS